MTNFASSHTKERIAHKIRVLREYAARAILLGGILTPEETNAQKEVLEDLWKIAGGFGVTEKELIHLILKGLDHPADPCRCAACWPPQVPQGTDRLDLDGLDADGLDPDAH